MQLRKALTEEDYSTTDWKVVRYDQQWSDRLHGSWFVGSSSQMKEAGDNADDIAYMPFPITLASGKQAASVGPDYSFGINADASEENQAAALCFVKFMAEESGFSMTVADFRCSKDTRLPDFYAAFKNYRLRSG